MTGSVPKALRPSKLKKPKKLKNKTQKPKPVSPVKDMLKGALVEKLIKRK